MAAQPAPRGAIGVVGQPFAPRRQRERRRPHAGGEDERLLDPPPDPRERGIVERGLRVRQIGAQRERGIDDRQHVPQRIVILAAKDVEEGVVHVGVERIATLHQLRDVRPARPRSPRDRRRQPAPAAGQCGGIGESRGQRGQPVRPPCRGQRRLHRRPRRQPIRRHRDEPRQRPACVGGGADIAGRTMRRGPPPLDRPLGAQRRRLHHARDMRTHLQMVHIILK